MRILDPSSTPSLDGIDMLEQEAAAFEKLLNHREGIVFVTGPTGSGKTTTLYAALRRLATEKVNIMTVEDPVEYEMSGLTQIQVAPAQGVTFATSLRAILRQDPDIVLVGEIRDLETAEIAVQASLTGHLVLSTLHTNDAVGAIRRLTDLGLERSAIAESLRGVVAQRLVRRVCPECNGVQPTDVTAEPEQSSLDDEECEHCGGTGFRGRAPVNEVLVMTPALQEMIIDGASPQRLYRQAEAQGTRWIRAAAMERVDRGQTTLEEMDNVLGEDSRSAAATEAAGEAMPPTPESRQEPVAKVVATGASDPPQAPLDRPATDCPQRILLAEDDGVQRTVITAILEEAGYEVVPAHDGFEAIRMLETQASSFDLLITDLDMPEMSGRSLLHQVRQSAIAASLPVVVLTGSSDADQEARLIEQGADDYLRKTTDPARFIARVRASLRRTAA